MVKLSKCTLLPCMVLAISIFGLALTGCEDKLEPTPITETIQEPTFRDYALESLQDYHNNNPSAVYTPQSLERMLDYAEHNESLISDYDGRDFHILTEFLGDNPDATSYPTAVDSYVREIDDMIFDYCQRDYDDYVREAINLNWSNFLPFLESGEVNGNEFNYLPRAIFVTDLVERRDGYEIDSRYNSNIPTLRTNLIDIIYRNIQSFQAIRDNALSIVEHDDYLAEASGKFTTERILLDWIPQHTSVFSAPQAQADIKELLEKGSDSTKAWLTLYAVNLTRWGSNSNREETRVELTIGDIWALPELGLRPYRIDALGHGELACDTEQSDLDLMQGLSDEDILVLPSPYGGSSINVMWTRIQRAKQDGIKEIKYVPDYGGWEILIELD